MSAPRKPTIGSIVHYFPQDKPEPRAAIVTRANTLDESMVWLFVFGRGSEAPQQLLATAYSQEGRPGTWRWPE